MKTLLRSSYVAKILRSVLWQADLGPAESTRGILLAPAPPQGPTRAPYRQPVQRRIPCGPDAKLPWPSASSQLLEQGCSVFLLREPRSPRPQPIRGPSRAARWVQAPTRSVHGRWRETRPSLQTPSPIHALSSAPAVTRAVTAFPTLLGTTAHSSGAVTICFRRQM